MDQCKNIFYWVFYCWLVLVGCKKDNADGLSCSTVLLLKEINNEIQLTWDRVEVARFEKYLVERASKPFNDLQVTIDTVAIINDISKNNFVDQSPLVTINIHYRVSVYADGKLICSSPNDIFPDYTFIELGPLEVAFSEKSDVLYYFEKLGTNSNIIRNDYQNNEATHIAEDLGITFMGQISIGEHNGEEELYATFGKKHALIFDANDLSIIDTIKASSRIVDVVVKNGLVFLMTYDPYSLLIYD